MSAPYDRVRDRYLHDAAFKQCVDMLQSVILNLELTPNEVREAAVLACLIIEERYPKPLMYCLETGEIVRGGRRSSVRGEHAEAIRRLAEEEKGGE